MNLSGGMSLGARRGLIIDDDVMVNPLNELPLYAAFFADDPAWTDNPGVGQAVSSWRNGGTLAASGAYLDPTLGLVLPGVAGNYAYVPDEAALDITGDIAVVGRGALTDWTPATSQTFVAKWASSSTSWLLRLLTGTNVLRLDWVESGGTSRFVQSTAAIPAFVDLSTASVAFALDVDDGAGGHSVTFWTSTDDTTWTQLGTATSAGAFTTSVRNSTAPVTFGAYQDGGATLPLSGRLQAARIYDGSGFTTAGPSGTLVLDADFRRTAVGAFTCDTGQTVTVASTFNANQSTAGSRPTLTTSALLGGRRVVDFDGTDDRLEILTGVSLAQPFEVWWIGHTDATSGIVVGINSTSSSRYGLGISGAIKWAMNAGATYASGASASIDTAYLVRNVLNGASSVGYTNGATGATGDAGAGAVDQIILGCGRTAPATYQFFQNGKTAFLGILPAASITATHRRQFALWAASFYGVPGFAAAA